MITAYMLTVTAHRCYFWLYI